MFTPLGLLQHLLYLDEWLVDQNFKYHCRAGIPGLPEDGRSGRP